MSEIRLVSRGKLRSGNENEKEDGKSKKLYRKSEEREGKFSKGGRI